MNTENPNLNEARNNIGKIVRELNNKGEFDLAMKLKDEMNNITRITNM